MLFLITENNVSNMYNKKENKEIVNSFEGCALRQYAE